MSTLNLLMLSGDSSVAQGQDGAFSRMLHRFSPYWNRVDVICPGAPRAKPCQIAQNVYVHPSPWHRLAQPWYIFRKGRALFAERGYDLVISHDFGIFQNGIGAWLLTRGTGVPYVSEIHHVEGYPRAATRREQVYRALAMIYIRWVWPRAAGIRTVNTVEIPNLLRKLGVPDEKILILPSLYIDFELFRPIPQESRQCDVLFVGRLVPNKGLFTLIEAIAQVKTTHPDIRLAILGSGPLRKALEAQIASLQLNTNATFISRTESAEDLAQIYDCAAMLVCASTSEGGPRVTVEAMACGVPVVSTPVGVMAELIEDGENGLIFLWDASQLADKIRLLLNDETQRLRLAENGRLSVQKFDADHVIERYARAYLDLIQRFQQGTR